MKKIVITGGDGLLGRHSSIHLHALNCFALSANRPKPFFVTRLSHNDYDNTQKLVSCLREADVVLHFAGMNRGPSDEVEKTNPEIAQKLVDACLAAGSSPHIIYANSTHYLFDTPYGRSKLLAHEILSRHTLKYTNVILPHIFGEGAKPYYNNVTATFIDQIIDGELPIINPHGKVELLHAGMVAEMVIDATENEKNGDLRPSGKIMSVDELLGILTNFHSMYSSNIYPELKDLFELSLFNTYRNKLYPHHFPRKLNLYKDNRGSLFEAVKGDSGGQTFLSWTEPGITRGDHFHLRKVERFLVLQGQATIRIRPVQQHHVWTYNVNGDEPSIIDIPTLHTHSIENTGQTPLLTLFWTNEIFDPKNPDTFADKVL